MTLSMQQVLDKYDTGLSEDEFVAALDASLAQRPPRSAVALSAAERDVLVEAGVPHKDLEPLDPAEIVGLQSRQVTDLASGSDGVDDVARRLGVSPSRIRHRIADGSLYGFRLGTRVRLPRWQFTDGERTDPLPHLRSVLKATPSGITPLELALFMATPQPELALGDEPLTPRTWLLAGQVPDPVIEMLVGLYQW